MIDIMKQGLGQARPNKTAFAKQRTPQWGFQAAERSALADGGALPQQVLKRDYSERQTSKGRVSP